MINDVDDIKLVSDCVKRVCFWRFLYIKDTAYGEKEFMRKFFAHVSTTFAAGDHRDPNLESGVDHLDDSRAFKLEKCPLRSPLNHSLSRLMHSFTHIHTYRCLTRLHFHTMVTPTGRANHGR